MIDYLFVGRHAFVVCISYVVLAENLLTGVTFHGEEVCNIQTKVLNFVMSDWAGWTSRSQVSCLKQWVTHLNVCRSSQSSAPLNLETPSSTADSDTNQPEVRKKVKFLVFKPKWLMKVWLWQHWHGRTHCMLADVYHDDLSQVIMTFKNCYSIE